MRKRRWKRHRAGWRYRWALFWISRVRYWLLRWWQQDSHGLLWRGQPQRYQSTGSSWRRMSSKDWVSFLKWGQGTGWHWLRRQERKCQWLRRWRWSCPQFEMKEGDHECAALFNFSRFREWSPSGSNKRILYFIQINICHNCSCGLLPISNLVFVSLYFVAIIWICKQKHWHRTVYVAFAVKFVSIYSNSILIISIGSFDNSH